MDKVTLFEQYRLVERNENEVNGAWRGAHLLLFFLAFVFGSFCTFCFHMLMYLFDEKCVLYPKLVSLSGIRHSILYDFVTNKEDADALPVDFVTTQWVEKSTCYLPTYVPLLSGIFGLVWTTMFLMCSSGSPALTGLQRSWRCLPSIFIFSIAMGSLCVYTSVITYAGLMELCVKLGEITGNTMCSYTINVATLAYQRRIRGVYQAVRLTIITAWLHTACWMLAAILAILRIILVVDFRLVRIRAELQGDIDRMLERHEKHIRTVSPDAWAKDDYTDTENVQAQKSSSSIKIHFKSETFGVQDGHSLKQSTSELSLVPDEYHKVKRLTLYRSVPDEAKFIVKLLYDHLDNIILPENAMVTPTLSPDSFSDSSITILPRQIGKQVITSSSEFSDIMVLYASPSKEGEIIVKYIVDDIFSKVTHRLTFNLYTNTSSAREISHYESRMNITQDLVKTLEKRNENTIKNTAMKLKSKLKKSNLKNRDTQTNIENLITTPSPTLRMMPSKTDSVITLKPDDVQSEPERYQVKPETIEKETQAEEILDKKSSHTEVTNEKSPKKENKDKETQTDPKEKQD